MGDNADALSFERFGQIYVQEYAKAHNKSLKDKVSRVRILGRKLDDVRVDALTRSHVTAFINMRKAEGTGNRTINRDLAVLHHMLEWGAKEQYLRVNPLPSIQKLKEVGWEGQRPTDEVVDAVFDHLDLRVVPLFTFIRWTGCRREEGLSLKHDQIDWERREVVFLADVAKNGRSRRVPLVERAIWALKAQPRASEYIFYHPESLTRWHDCRKPWEEAREAAGREWLRVHDLRHAYAIRLAERGCPMHFLSEVLGHRSADFTRRLSAKFSPESASNAVRAYLERPEDGQVPPAAEAVRGYLDGGSQIVANLSLSVN